MKILIVGGSGFIGRHLIDFIHSFGYEVFSLGRTEIKKNCVKSIIIPELTLQNIERSILGYDFDAVINLATAGVSPYDRDIVQFLNINVALPSYMLSAGLVCGAKAFITVGSCSEYNASCKRGKLTEGSSLETTKIYGASKAAGGLMALAQGIHLKIPVAVARLFNVFGPGELPHRLLPSLISNLRNQNSVSLSSGRQIRDFIYVKDACSGIISLLHALLDGRLESGAYNISTGIGTTVKEFCYTTARLMGANKEFLNFGAIPLRPDDYKVVVGDSKLIQNKTDWKPEFSIEHGIIECLRSY